MPILKLINRLFGRKKSRKEEQLEKVMTFALFPCEFATGQELTPEQQAEVAKAIRAAKHSKNWRD